jgi:hypothetical protein
MCIQPLTRRRGRRRYRSGSWAVTVLGHEPQGKDGSPARRPLPLAKAFRQPQKNLCPMRVSRFMWKCCLQRQAAA